MTAITRSTASPQPNPLQSMETNNESTAFSPSSSVEEAKSRFASALSNGVDKLMRLGHGRERASVQVLNEIADGCSPDEDEIFKMMASRGLSMDDATKASTVSSAFRRAMSSKGSNVDAIDELTSRLCLAKLAHRNEPLRPASKEARQHEVEPKSPAASLTTRASAQNLISGGNRSKSPKTPGDKIPHKGKKRVLAEKEKCPVAMEAKAADVEVNAKLSKEDEKKVAKDSASGRSKSVTPAVTRGKRGASLRADEGQPVKRVRSTSTI